MPTIIHLHDIQIKLPLSAAEACPLSGVQMRAQIILNNQILVETRPVDCDPSHDLWKFDIDYKIPLVDTPFFVNILRDNETTSPSLLGSATIGPNQIDSGKHEHRFGLELSIAVLSLALELTAQLTVSATESPRFATRLMQMFDATTRNATVDTDCLELWVIHQNILLLPTTDRIRTDYLNKLGQSCWILYQTSQLSYHLDRAISAHSDGVENGWEDPMHLWDLGSALLIRFKKLGDVDDIEKALRMFKKLDELIPIHHPLKHSVTFELGTSFLKRFELLGRVEDVQHAVVVLEPAVELIPDDHMMKPAILDLLAQCLMRRFGCLGNRDDIDRSVNLSERSIQFPPPYDPGRPLRLSNLGTFLLRRLERLGDVNKDDINKSIQHFEEAGVASDGPGDPRIQASLGAALMMRFIMEGSLSDIEDAIRALDMAVDLVPANSDHHCDKHVMLNNLGNALHYRFERINCLNDLNRAVTVYRDAVELAPKGPDRLSWLGHLGDALRCRFERLGDLGDIQDLNDSVTTLEKVVEDTPPDDPELFVPLNNLGNALQCRFEWFGARKDIDEAILKLRGARRLMLPDHPRKPLCLSNLGSALLYRFKRYEDESDIEESLQVLTECVNSTKENDPSRCRVLNNFGNAHLQRYKWKGDHADPDDLTKAISALRKAAGHMSNDHAVKPTVLNNLSNALQIRGSPSDIKASICELGRVVQFMPENHPSRPSRLRNLAKALSRGDETDRKKALAHYRSAACSSTGPAGVRFEASMTWAYLGRIYGDQSLYAYQVALDLLPDVAWLGVSIPDRHQLIMKAGEFVRDAAAAAIAVQKYDKAVEWLEQGRSIIWGQLLDLRNPVKELEKQHPGLARQFISLSQQLEGAGDGNNRPEGVLTSQAEKQPSMQTVADSTHQYAQQRRELLKEIRGLENFNDFSLPKTRSKLVQAAREGPVVILNVSSVGCDALLLRPGEADIMHVRLPDFKVDDADIMAKDLKDAVGGREGGPVQEDERTGKREGRSPDDTLSAMLRTLWHRVVKPVLDALGMTPSRNPSRLWWCPTGSLAFLPIHAAGLYGQHDPFGSKLSESDFVVSSYAPSLTALIAAFDIRSARRGDVKILAVTQSSASGHRYIPGTEEEVSRIKVICNAKAPVIPLDGNAATKASVEDGMRWCSWVHFACHGVQDASNPTQSALLISGDSRFTLSDIINLSLRDKDLAYLSACQTATGAKAFQEESVHLGAGMLCAGFSGVIATMWSIGDHDAPQVAGDVYEQLFKTSTPDSSQAAKAVHLATKKLQLKSEGKKFVNWVPYIHIGV